MTNTSFEHGTDARESLRRIVSDPAYGADALSSPRTMADLLKHLLPDAPRERWTLLAAVEAGLADTVRGHVAGGMLDCTYPLNQDHSCVRASSPNRSACPASQC